MRQRERESEEERHQEGLEKESERLQENQRDIKRLQEHEVDQSRQTESLSPCRENLVLYSAQRLLDRGLLSK